MSPLKVITPTKLADYRHLQRSSAIEQGRTNALDLLVKGRPLHEVLTPLIISFEAASDDAKCAILLVSQDKSTLSPLVAPSLPDYYLNAIHSTPIGPGVGCCGEAAYSQQPVFISDISNHLNWQSLQALVNEAELKACWSYPIISPDGEIYGTFAMYSKQAKLPSQDDIDSLEYEAKIVSIIVERFRNIEQLQHNNLTLERKVEERNRELTESNLLLKKVLEQRNDVQSQLIEMENMAALGTMMSSLTHEINTPVGVAITAISHLQSIQNKSHELFTNNALKRSDLNAFYQECAESSDIVERNLHRATELIKTFKQLAVDQHSQEARPLNLCDYVCEVLLSLKPRLKRTQHKFCLDIDPDFQIISNPGAISQLLINLIMNSALHAFPRQPNGKIHIKARKVQTADKEHELVLEYRDNGKGMTQHVIENIYKPFFTSNRSGGGSGLGMHICYNIVVKVLRGRIDCESEPGQGVHFTLRFPLNDSCPAELT